MDHITSTLSFKDIQIDGYERVVEIVDKEAGLHAIVAIHNTQLGPALGGIRAYPYPTFDVALNDALRLAKGMTYKAAVTEMGTGGGKAVIIIDNRNKKSEKLLLAFAEAVNQFQGKYICAEDMGMSVADLAVIRKGTRYAVGLPHSESSGDPSPFTSRGVYLGIQAVCKKLWGSDSVKGKKIAIQGLGTVGMKLANYLFWEGAHLIVSDLREERVKEAVKNYGAKRVLVTEIYDIDCDIFSPCAMGGILNPHTLSRFSCKAIAGSANNQLLSDADGEALKERNILYAPDYVINSGGLINVCTEIEEMSYNHALARNRLNHIYDLLFTIFTLAEEKKQSTCKVANELAEYNINNGIGKRTKECVFHH